MYEELYERLPDAGAYLERIGLGGEEIKPDLSALDRLVHAHLTHVPFEDMEPWGTGNCPDLAVKALFDKIVLRRRGGYCFELNSLFYAFLKELGFDVYMVMAHVMAERAELPPPCHCCVICSFEGEKYFCDVGYGGAVPDGGVKLSGESRHGFRLERSGIFYRVINEKNGCEELRFKDVPIAPVELIPMNYYISQGATSPFRNQLHLNLRLEDGSVSVVDHVFKLRHSGQLEERRIDIADVPAILEEYFGIPSGGIKLRELGPFPG